MQKQAIHIRNLGVRLAPDFAVVIEQLDLQPGEVLVLDAVSGAGKSTVLGLIAGAITASAFENTRHELDGLNIHGDGSTQVPVGTDKLGFVLQTNVLIPYLTLGENIRLPLEISGKKVDKGWYEHVVAALGLSALLDRKPTEVSVGQRQRATIARALAPRPKILLLDEPVSALDPANVAQVEELISILAQEAEAATILASHQAQSGVFASALRGSHEVIKLEGVTYSVFSGPPKSDTQLTGYER
jgi:putative ABC transport system ATP-binding protein